MTRNEQGRRQDRAVARSVAKRRASMTPQEMREGQERAARVREQLRAERATRES